MLTSRSGLALITLTALAAAGGIGTFIEPHEPANLSHPLDSLPVGIDGWQAAVASEALDPDILAALKASAYLSRDYTKGNEQMGLFIAYYATQHAGEAIHSPRHCLPSNGWEISDQRTQPLAISGRQVRINDVLIRRLDQKKRMLYWYQSRHRIYANEFEGKFLLLRDAIAEGHTEGSLVRIICSDSPSVRHQAIRFAQILIPELRRCLGGDVLN
jgi:EpsI family protein